MLLQALHEYAETTNLLADLPLQRRTLDALIDLDHDGKLRVPYLKRLTSQDRKGNEIVGFDYLLPRFPGENNGGKAYFLAEGAIALFGRDKVTGEPIPAPVGADAKAKDKNPTKAFRHFWDQIQSAFDATHDKRLKAMLEFKREYLLEQDGLIRCQLPFIRMRPKDKGKQRGEPEFVANTGADDGNYIVVEKSTFGFSVDGVPVTVGNEGDPLREHWYRQFARQAFFDDLKSREADEAPTTKTTLCIVSGRVGEPIARSHKPKILGIPGIAAGGYVVSFAKANPAFSSYGFEMGENSPVSQSAAAAYALALIELLRSEDNHINLGPVAVCSWAKKSPKVAGQFARCLNKAYPEEVAAFLKAPFAGHVEREALHSDRLFTVALTGNAGRIVIQHWLSQTLDDAAKHFQQWWQDLQVVSIFSEQLTDAKGKRTDAAELPPSPFAIPNLARATLRESKQQKNEKLVTERIVQLYRAAREGTVPSLMLLKPILDEFQSALLKNDPRLEPFNTSRFALIKLILIRNQCLPLLSDGKKGHFMQLVADTTDDAYNCGRLLAVMEALQNRSRIAGRTQQERKKADRPGAGVITRYYGRASTAPATVFSMLLGLSQHHEAKLQRGNESDKKAAGGFENRKIEILSRMRPDANEPNSPPSFPKILKLVEQGRFALGFYHQKAHDREQLRRYRATQGQEGDDLADTEEGADTK